MLVPDALTPGEVLILLATGQAQPSPFQLSPPCLGAFILVVSGLPGPGRAASLRPEAGRNGELCGCSQGAGSPLELGCHLPSGIRHRKRLAPRRTV